ncbi:MAG: hypothetical protein R3225_09075 [Halofilum sp. (in: g-proteobacteria)]|nr:hypothetical protein [Halofilum sp. (in: g-proteobacteria)]
MNGRCARAYRPFLVFVLLLVTLPLRAADLPLVRLQEIAAAGAPGLALKRLDAGQPDAADDPRRWVEWERARISILVEAGAWERAAVRLADLPPATPEPFRRWALEQRAAFRIELGEAERARALLRELVWGAGPGADSGELRRWRQLVIRSYLVDGRTGDAVTALRRFDQDYPDAPPEWAVLRTRVLLRAGRAAEAVSRLPAETSGELRVLGLLARVRAAELAAGAAWEEAVGLAQSGDRSLAERGRLWVVAAEAAAAQSSPERRALALERAASLAQQLSPSDVLFAVDGDALWSAWIDYGLLAGNRRELLIGDDPRWFEAAEASLPQHPVRARSLLAVVAQRGGADSRPRAHARLLELLAADKPGMAAARHAYLRAGRYASVDSIPENVRYRLVDDALARNDVTEATRLLATLSEAPSGVEPFSWQLLRARVLVLGGRIDDGVDTLHRVLDEHAELPGQRLDRFLQVVFDLQGAEEHEAAMELLERVGLRDLPPQRRRELLYWQAESREAQERYQEAAQLFLRSATLTDPRGGDPWGQTALYQAAEVLAQIGLVGDARRIYRRLLRVTEEDARRSTLRHRLQQLRLREPDPEDVPAPAEEAP